MVLICESTLGAVGIGAVQNPPQILQTQSIVIQNRRVDVDPNGRQCSATNIHLTDAFHL